MSDNLSNLLTAVFTLATLLFGDRIVVSVLTHLKKKKIHFRVIYDFESAASLKQIAISCSCCARCEAQAFARRMFV